MNHLITVNTGARTARSGSAGLLRSGNADLLRRKSSHELLLGNGHLTHLNVMLDPTAGEGLRLNGIFVVGNLDCLGVLRNGTRILLGARSSGRDKGDTGTASGSTRCGSAICVRHVIT